MWDLEKADGLVLSDGESGHNGVIVIGADHTVTVAEISMLTDADGTDTRGFPAGEAMRRSLARTPRSPFPTA